MLNISFFLWAMNRELKPVIQAGQEQPPWIIGSRTCPGKEIVEPAHDSKAGNRGNISTVQMK